MTAVVIGIGNEWRRDDGVGPRVALALDPATRCGPVDLTALTLDGEPARVVEAWTGADLAIVVDAVRSGAAPGTVHRYDGDDVLAPPPGTVSSHGTGLRDALQLGRAVGRLPRQLVVFGVEGADFGAGIGLSPAVEAAVDTVVSYVDDELSGLDGGDP